MLMNKDSKKNLIDEVISSLIKRAKETGALTTDDVYSELVTKCDADAKQADEVLELLAQKDILVLAQEDIAEANDLKDSYGVSAPLLTAEEELDLAYKIREGDKDAKDKLVLSNMRLVYTVAKHYTGRGVDFDDLIQSGNIGLMKATEKFDPDKGFRFSTCATWWIKQAIVRTISEDGRTVRLPAYVKERVEKLGKIISTYSVEHGHDPEIDYLIDAMGESKKKVLQYLSLMQKTVSIYESVGEEEDSILLDFLEADESVRPDVAAEKKELISLAQRALSRLTASEQSIIRLRFGLDDDDPKTLEEIGELYNVTRERVRQIEQKALAKLRYPSFNKELIYYYGNQKQVSGKAVSPEDKNGKKQHL